MTWELPAAAMGGPLELRLAWEHRPPQKTSGALDWHVWCVVLKSHGLRLIVSVSGYPPDSKRPEWIFHVYPASEAMAPEVEEYKQLIPALQAAERHAGLGLVFYLSKLVNDDEKQLLSQLFTAREAVHGG